MAPLKSFSELAFKKDKDLPNLKVPVKGKRGVSRYMRKAGISSKKPYDSEFRQRMVASVQSADKKPEKYVKPDGKVGVRMVKTDKEVIKKEQMQVYRVGHKDMSGNVHATTPEDAMKKLRKKGLKGDIKLTHRGSARSMPTRKITKEAVEYPHMMYDPKTGNEVKAKTPADHNKYAKMGYTHEKPKVDEAIKHTHAVVDPAGKVAGMTSNERDAKDIARRHKGKVVKLKKPMSPNKGDMMINRPFKEDVDEALTLQQRMKRSRLMKRLKTRIKIGRDRARRKMANKKTLEKRAMRQARAAIAKKLTRGIPKAELTFARKQEIEKRLDKPALKSRIKRIAKRIFKDVRKKEVQRKKG